VFIHLLPSILAGRGESGDVDYPAKGPQVATPLKTGVQKKTEKLDSRLRGNDGKSIAGILEDPSSLGR
jgi:hypothetical protein